MIDSKELVCPKCKRQGVETDKDKETNLCRMREQVQFRKKDEVFDFPFVASCDICGRFAVHKKIKNIKLK